MFQSQITAQIAAQAQYGNTLNLGLGLGGHYGYYRYAGSSVPMLHIDYEFNVANHFTLAPSFNIHSFSRPSYRETGLGVGLKGFFYFDDIVKAGSKWDFYIGGTLGFVVVNSRWDANYKGDREFYRRTTPLLLDFHLGTEYHVNNRLGFILDFSTGVSTIGIAIH